MSVKTRPLPRPQDGPELLAEILRSLRRSAGCSQLDLSLKLGISQRHLSFVEIARARPSRDLLMSWLDALDASGSMRNAALIHAGFQPIHKPDESDDSLLREALEGLVRAHEPYPAVIFDPDWFAVSISDGGARLVQSITPDLPASLDDPMRGLDMIGAIAHPDGLLANAEDPAVIAAAFLRQFEAEAWARPSLRQRVRRCTAVLQARYGPLPSAARNPATPHLRLAFRVQGERLSFFTVQAVVGLPQNVTVDSVRAELWFPEDDVTRRFLADGSRLERDAAREG